MRIGLIFFLISWLPVMAALPSGNPRWADMEKWSDTVPRLSEKHDHYVKMGVAYEVIFGTTNEAHGEDLLNAAIFLLKHAKKAKSWSLAPKFPRQFRKQGKEDGDEVMRHPFFANLLHANRILDQALTLSDPTQRLQRLQLIYPHQADHWPTLMALCETYWALNQLEEGDKFLKRALDQEPLEALWPALVAQAKYLRRTESQPEALELLRQAKRFSFNKQNPANELLLEWEAETRAAEGDAAKLAEWHAWDELKTLAKKGDTLAMRHSATQVYKVHKFQRAKKWLKKRIKKEPGDGEAMRLFLNRGIGLSDGEASFLFKRAKKFQGTQRELAKVFFVRSFDPKLSPAEAATLRGEGVEADPSFRDAWIWWIDKLRANGDHEGYDAAEARFWKAFPSAQTLADLVIRRNEFGGLAPYLALLERAEQGYLGNTQVGKALARGSEKLKDTDQFERLQYYVLNAALTSAHNLRYLEAAEMLNDLHAVDETNREINLMVANCLYQAGAYEKAMIRFKQAKEDFPGSTVIQELYGDVLFINNAGIRADRNFRKAKQAGGNGARIQAKLDEMSELPGLLGSRTTPYHYERKKPPRVEGVGPFGDEDVLPVDLGIGLEKSKTLSRRQRPTACYGFRGEPAGPLTFWTMTRSDIPTALHETGPLLEPLRVEYRQWQAQFGKEASAP